MGIGILQPVDDIAVCGTRLLDAPPPNARAEGADVKRHPTNPRIVLQPQSSDDPADPLNWSRLRKELFFWALMLNTTGAGVIGPLLIPAFSSMAVELDTDLTGMAGLNAILVMFLGISSYLGIILGRIYGKRPILLLTLAFQLGGLAWGATAQSYWSLYGARILQGIGCGAFACLGTALVSDIFFLHEQGLRIALWQLAWVVSVNVCPLLSAQIISSRGWRVAFWICFGYVSLGAIAYFSLCPETTFDRRPVERPVIDVDVTGEPDGPVAKDTHKHGSIVVNALENGQAPAIAVHQRTRSPWAILNGRMNDKPLSLEVLRTFGIVLTPPVLWCTATYGFLFSCTIMSGAVFAQIFAAPPYALSTNTIGVISGVGPLIGSLVASLVSGPLADMAARFLSKRNNGYFEPEMYLVLMIPALILHVAGFVGWGYTVDAASPPVVPAVMIAVCSAGDVFGFCGTILYSSACFPPRQGDAFGIIMLIKSCIAFGLLKVVNKWLATRGPVEFFGALAGIGGILCLMAVLFWIWGKRIRAWTERNRLLGWTTR